MKIKYSRKRIIGQLHIKEIMMALNLTVGEQIRHITWLRENMIDLHYQSGEKTDVDIGTIGSDASRLWDIKKTIQEIKETNGDKTWIENVVNRTLKDVMEKYQSVIQGPFSE